MITSEYKFPDYKEILILEKKSNKIGSGITSEDLEGLWKFQYVWKKGEEIKDQISSSILQVLSASLELKKSITENKTSNFEIKNSIRFGLISIVFSGKAYLKGTRLINYR